ncbi:glycosyl transferase [Comamonas serinivorans]|uniref:Glycosyl transferase n=1 Tax=Comamonas serinivorans TaxID=1082851 RepID=A0A1Y0ERT8_9BURK|nr:glycosyltransferase [Comamonas serinivorans]ARU06286.1 glycosyl transferase [Comamonas serinivorans]
MIALAWVAFMVSLMGTLWVRRAFRKLSRPYSLEAPQRFHAGQVSRLGGLGVLIGWAVGLAAIPVLQRLHQAGNIAFDQLRLPVWLLVLAPAFMGGLLDDITQRVGPRWRLLLSLGTGCLAVALLQLSVTRLGFAALDDCWRAWPWLGMGLAVLAVAGLPHAFNIIDGYNGLAGVMAVVVCLALAHVALQVGDRQLAAIAIALAAATAGFLVWNYPRGLIFAGDSGAYLWGSVVAILSITLVQRHPIVSPWFPMLLLIYPVWETLFSIYRKMARGDSPGMADALHLHQLVYRRIVRSVLDGDEAQRLLSRNNRTAPYLWGFIGLTVVPAILFWRYSIVLAAFCALFAVSYVAAYVALVRFKAQRFVRLPLGWRERDGE